MTGYTAALFVHLLGVVTLFAGIALQQSGAARLRAATSADEVRLWIGFLRPTAATFPAAVGVGLVGRGLRAIGRAAADAGTGPISAEIDRLIRAPRTWISLSALNGAALGVLWIMPNKPGWASSIAIVAAAAAAGGAFGAYAARRRTRRAAILDG